MGRALMSQPKLLLLDEPSMGLAPLLVEQVFAVIRRLAAEGVTISVVEQNAYAALQTADRGYVHETGCISLTGSGAALIAEPRGARRPIWGCSRAARVSTMPLLTRVSICCHPCGAEMNKSLECAALTGLKFPGTASFRKSHSRKGRCRDEPSSQRCRGGRGEQRSAAADGQRGHRPRRLGGRRARRQPPIPARPAPRSWSRSPAIRRPTSMPTGRPTRRWRSTWPSARRCPACARSAP